MENYYYYYLLRKKAEAAEGTVTYPLRVHLCMNLNTNNTIGYCRIYKIECIKSSKKRITILNLMGFCWLNGSIGVFLHVL